MEIKLEGPIIIQCDNCDQEFVARAEEVDWQYDSDSYPRKMSAEIVHIFSVNLPCMCGNIIRLEFNVYEYPEGQINDPNLIDYAHATGGEILQAPVACAYESYYELDTAEESVIYNDYFQNVSYFEQVLSGQQRLNTLSANGFEDLVGDVFSRQGYTVSITKRTRDGGFDAVAAKDVYGIPYSILIECKRYAEGHKVGVGLIRGLYGVLTDTKANKAILVTSSGFTKDAMEFADRQKHLISLVDANKLIKMMKQVSACS